MSHPLDYQVNAMYRGIIDAPAEDTPRLMFVDLLLERDEPGDAAKARFIQLMFDLEKYPTRHVYHGPIENHGPNYYAIEVDEEFEPNIGDRVDVHWSQMHKPARLFPGLQVTKVLAADDGLRLALRKDEHSLPFPTAEMTTTALEAKSMFDELCGDWSTTYSEGKFYKSVLHKNQYISVAPDYPSMGPVFGAHVDNHGTRLLMKKGIASIFSGTWESWHCLNAQLCDRNPIHEVEITGDRTSPTDEWLTESECREQWPKITKWTFPS